MILTLYLLVAFLAWAIAGVYYIGSVIAEGQPVPAWLSRLWACGCIGLFCCFVYTGVSGL